MKIRAVASAVAAGAVVAAGLVGLSSPAQALPSSTWQITVDCAQDIFLPGTPGDTYDFTLTGDCVSVSDYSYLWNEAYDDDAGEYLNNGFLGVPANAGSLDYYSCSNNCGVADPSDWYNYVYSEPETVVGVQLLSTNQVGQTLTPGSIVGNVYTDLTETGWDIYWMGAQGQGTPPPSWYQGVGRASADATCDVGWSPSWALWPNGGTGGWVCVREQYYDTATGSWSYRAARK